MAGTELVVDKFRYRGAQPGDVLTGVDADGYMEPRPGGTLTGGGGSFELEMVLNPDTGRLEFEEVINADGEWDVVYIWRAD